MSKEELAKRIVALVKDKKKLREWAVLGLHYSYDKGMLWQMYDKLKEGEEK